MNEKISHKQYNINRKTDQMKLRTLLAAGAVMLVTADASAIVAKRGLLTIPQPDGTTVKAYLQGDEHHHYYLSEDSCVMLADESQNLCYAALDASGNLVSSGIKAVDISRRSAQAKAFIARTDRNALMKAAADMRREPSKSMQRIPQSGIGLCTTTFPSTGDVPACVILVSYSDVDFTLDDPYDYFNRLLNGETFTDYGGTGSARQYFIDQSHGLFRPQFDVYGPVKLSRRRSYYGANDSYGNDKNAWQMVTDALSALDPDVDFSKYDTDNDGYIDNVYVFYAGGGEATGGGASTVWPHSFDISSAGAGTYRYDGVIVDHYACSNEWEASTEKPDGIGTFVHEFSHVLGLPDLYATTYTSAFTPGEWSVLDYGPYNNDGRTPPAYSIYERNALKWMEPRVLDGPATIELKPITESNDGCIIPTSKKSEFFLLENRQQEGWDTYLPGHGMLVWHIDYVQSVWDYNRVNNTATHQYVDLEEANNSTVDSPTARAGNSFPGTSGKTSFTDETVPSMRTWAGASLNRPLTNIQESTDGYITFDVCGGRPPVDVPELLEATDVDEDGFTANWQQARGANDYILRVTYVMKSEEGPVEETADFTGSATNAVMVPDGWSTNVTTIYNSVEYAGKNKPSLQMKTDGAYVESRELSADIDTISVWVRGVGSNESTTFAIKVLVNGQWQTIQSSPITHYKSGEVITIEDLPAGVRKARVELSRPVSGTLALDDFKVSSKGDLVYAVAGYDGIHTGNVTSCRVDGLPAGVRDFKYQVAATDGSYTSTFSDAMAVSRIPSGLQNVASGSDHVSLTVNGNCAVITAMPGTPVSIADMQGRTVASAVVGSAGVLSVSLRGGIYIVRAGNSVIKAAIR